MEIKMSDSSHIVEGAIKNRKSLQEEITKLKAELNKRQAEFKRGFEIGQKTIEKSLLKLNEGMVDKNFELATNNEKLKAENEKLRKLLWFKHGCSISALYGDDGCMDCNKCVIDFKNDSPKAMEIAWEKMALKQLEE
jgi:hypothetical protein